MRTTHVTTPGPSRLQLAISYPNSIAFMYSRQPVILQSEGHTASDLEAAVTLTHTASGRTHTERRHFFNERADFDVSRVMQLLAPDVNELFRRLDYSEGQSLSEAFALEITYTDTDGEVYPVLSADDITALYGALDQGEIYGEHTQRRLWLNFPQTFNLWRDADGEVAFVLEDSYVYPDIAADAPCGECDLVGALIALNERDSLVDFFSGRPIRNVALTWKARIEKGTETPDEFRLVSLIPEDCRSCDGTYLRWLNRRGEVSYWLFRNSEIRTTSAVNSSFARYYGGDPAEPQGGVYNNSQLADFREVREMVLGAVGLSRDEYEDLCDLATSPLVERLMPNVREEDTAVDVVYDGGSSTTDSDVIIKSEAGLDTGIDGGDSLTGNRVEGPHIWQRVNVAPGTFARSIRRNTPNRQDLEFIIELPERNTVKL